MLVGTAAATPRELGSVATQVKQVVGYQIEGQDRLVAGEGIVSLSIKPP